jgi:hypothetical protein
LSIYFEKTGANIFLVIGWDDEIVRMPISFF